MPPVATTTTVGYYDSDDEEDGGGGGETRWARDTGGVPLPLAARACDACNQAGERAHGLAAAVAASSRAAQPALEGAGVAALAGAERVGVAAGDSVAAALIAPGGVPPSERLCNTACRLEGACEGAQPALAAVEGAVVPWMQPIGELLLAIDRDVCAGGDPGGSGGCGDGDSGGIGLRAPVLRALAGLERLGLALHSASAVVEEKMNPVCAALDARLGKLAHWGDTRLGIQVRKPLRRYL